MRAGGEVSGGEMGAGDFTMEVKSGGTTKKVAGSAKFLKSLSDAKQAASHSSWSTVNDEVHYVIAVRRQEKGDGSLPPQTQVGQSTVGGKPQTSPRSHQIRAIDIYYLIAQVVRANKELKIFNAKGEDLGNVIAKASSSGSDFKFLQAPSANAAKTFVGRLSLYDATGENLYRKQLDDVQNKGTGPGGFNNPKTGVAYNAAKNYFRQLFNAEEKAKQYVSVDEGDFTKIKNYGDAAIRSYEAADDHLVKLLDTLTGASAGHTAPKVKGTKGSRTFSENKNNLDKVLDKLIKEVILNK